MRIRPVSERGPQCQQGKARDDLGLAGTGMTLAEACHGHGAHGPSRSRDELRPLHRRHRPPCHHLQPLGVTGRVRGQRAGRLITLDHRAILGPAHVNLQLPTSKESRSNNGAKIVPTSLCLEPSPGWFERLSLGVGSLGVGSCQSSPLSPLHEQIHPAIGDRMEAEPLVEPERGIEAFDVDAQQPARRSAKSEGGACRRPPPLIAVRRAASSRCRGCRYSGRSAISTMRVSS